MAGLYIHIPFCKQKCSYCDFHFSTTFHKYRTEMILAMCSEMDRTKDYLEKEPLESIYFGGGTPSLLTEQEIQKILETAHEHFEVLPNAEITLEANPDDITPDSVVAWMNAGINRLSIGLQSFREKDLAWMNRAHTADEALNCVKQAQDQGISNISVDLIYGLPDLSLKEWEQHIERVISMGIQHVSAYCLTVEEKTALHKLVQTHTLIPAGEDEQSDQFLLLSDKLKKAGFMHYEISNFGRPGFEAVHNANYWKGKKYLGIGPSAHSFNGTSRRWNLANNTQYIKRIEGNETWFEEEHLTQKDQWNELILTGLRTSYGVNLDQLKKIHPLTPEFLQNTNKFAELNWLQITHQQMILTDEGRLKADHIASELFL